MKTSKRELYWILFRLVIGFFFLWAFLDKLFGLGFSTTNKMSWLNGGSPTTGFLKSLNGSFSSFFTPLAGQPILDWIFMLGLLFIGLSLILGIFIKIGCIIGFIMVMLMWIALFPSKTNPIFDEHILYALSFIGIYLYSSDNNFSFKKYLARNK